jgi:hypothetical protein
MVMPQLVEWDSSDVEAGTPPDGFNGTMSPANLNFRLGFALNY